MIINFIYISFILIAKSADPYILAGLCHRELKNYEKMEEYLTAADEIKPGDLTTLQGLYQAHQYTDRFKNCDTIPKLCEILKKYFFLWF